MDTPRIEKNSRVTFHFTLSLATGEIAESTQGKEPMILVIGSDDMIEGLQKCLLGLRAGDKRRFEIPYDDAYGPADAARVHVLTRDQFPEELDVQPGQVIAFTAPSGEEVAGTVMKVDDDGVTVDFSHPLAGHDLIFEVEILNVEKG